MCLIRESVDSLCRDGADTPMPPYIGKAFIRKNVEELSLFRYLIMVATVIHGNWSNLDFLHLLLLLFLLKQAYRRIGLTNLYTNRL